VRARKAGEANSDEMPTTSSQELRTYFVDDLMAKLKMVSMTFVSSPG